MNLPQTSYDYKPVAGIPGMPYDSGGDSFVSTCTATAAINAGRGVISNGQDELAGTTVSLPDTSGHVTDHFQGVALFVAMKQPIAGSAAEFKATDSVPVMSKGRVWVASLDTSELVQDGPVYVVHSGANAGKFTGVDGHVDADPQANPPVVGVAATATLVAGAKCIFPGDGLAVIELNLP